MFMVHGKKGISKMMTQESIKNVYWVNNFIYKLQVDSCLLSGRGQTFLGIHK